MPARPASDTGRKNVILSLSNPSGFRPNASEDAATPGAEITQKCGAFGVNGVPQNSFSFGNQGLGGKSFVRTLPVKSITTAPASSAARKLRSTNSGDPVKNTSFALSKLPSSTG